MLGSGVDGRIQALEERLRILSEASHEFADATADYERLIDLVARRLASTVKDGCVVRLLSDDGWLTPAAIHVPIKERIADPAMRARVGAHVASRHHATEQGAAARVIETGEALLIAHLDLDELAATTTPEIVEVYRALGIHSVLIVPLRVRREAIGLLSLLRCSTPAPFVAQDLELAQVLADHAALAIANARLLRTARHELDARIRAEAIAREAEGHRVKAEFLARMSHELRTPLNAILGFSELLRDGRVGTLTTEQLTFVDQVLASGHQLLGFVDELLGIER
jgi:GAF domain-containing protein